MDQPLVDLGRFSDPAVLILISLADGPKHGYAMMDDIATLTGVRPGAGTLYGALARLEQRGWIEPLATVNRRRPYRLTDQGTAVLRTHLHDLRDIARAGLGRLATT